MTNTNRTKNTKQELIFELLSFFFIVLSIILFSIDTLPNLDKDWHKTLAYLDESIFIIFSIEYLIRLYKAPIWQKWKFPFHFYTLVDLFAILPFYLGWAVDLRALRILRIFAMLHFLNISKINKAGYRLRKAFLLVKNELILFFVFGLVLVYLASVGIFYFEREAQPELFQSIFHCLWWSIVTLTTLGYGDTYPITVGGRIFTFFVLVMSIGIIAIPSGLLAGSLILTSQRKKR